jgi:siderophore synthetase component
MTHPVTRQVTVVRTELSILLRLLREAGLTEKACWQILANHILDYFHDAGSWVSLEERFSYLVRSLKKTETLEIKNNESI